nr:uncharacterized protein LOC109190937 [Ipomoea batatas]
MDSEQGVAHPSGSLSNDVPSGLLLIDGSFEDDEAHGHGEGVDVGVVMHGKSVDHVLDSERVVAPPSAGLNSLKVFCNLSNGLKELVSDIEIWDLVSQIELQHEIKIWVVQSEDVTEENLNKSGTDGEWECDDEGDSDDSMVDIDDMDFEQFVDQDVEFGGLDNGGTGLTANPKKRVRVKPKKLHDVTLPSVQDGTMLAVQDGTMLAIQGNATLPEEDDDTWLADIDIDDVVSQFLPTQTQAEEIQLTSQPPPVGEEDDSQEQVHKALESKKAKGRATGRKYMTRRSVQSKFNNTQDDPIDIQ